MPNVKPKKTELASFKALNDIGLTPNAIGKITDRDPKTVRKWLTLADYQDPEIQEMIAQIKQNELDDLRLLGAKARARLHELLDAGDTKVIETVALMDRAFQQRRLLEGQSTQNVDILAQAVIEAGERLKQSARQRQTEEMGEIAADASVVS